MHEQSKKKLAFPVSSEMYQDGLAKDIETASEAPHENF